MEKLQPTNSLVNIFNTDLYQITMCYAYWKNGTENKSAVFDLFFRKCPFNGGYTVFCGLDEVLRLVDSFGFNEEQISFLKNGPLSNCEPEFFEWLSKIDTSKVTIYAQPHGSLVFPRVPLVRVEGPLAVCQLLETPLLNLVNYSSLIATNSSRMLQAAGPNKILMEFGLRRAQGPDGALSAAKYSYVGGFNSTASVQAGFLCGLPIVGTHAHAYVCSFTGFDSLKSSIYKSKNLLDLSLKYREMLVKIWDKYANPSPNDGELAAFINYAISFPNKCLCLIDTYDTIASGLLNFCSLALAMRECGTIVNGIRLDSGDLGYFSRTTRQIYRDISELFNFPELAKMTICASSDLNEDVLIQLSEEGHEIDVFGIGTSLVTCQKQPALGGVYKLAQIDGKATIKLSNDTGKLTLPTRKNAYRLYGKDNSPICDLLTLDDEPAPAVGSEVICLHPTDDTQRIIVKPARVDPLLLKIFEDGVILNDECLDLNKARSRCMGQLKCLRNDYRRLNITSTYKVSVTSALFNKIHSLLLSAKPIQTYE